MEKEAQAKDQQNDQDVGKDTAGATSSIKLLLKLSRMEDKSLGTSLPSPILQVDGGQAVDETSKYTFVSDYHEDDIEYTLEEIFPDSYVNLESLKQCQPMSADYLFSVDVKLSSGQNSKWPEMNSEQSPVFKELKKI